MLGFVEEIVLLLLDDEGQVAELPVSATHIVIAGAALMELALRNRIDTDVKTLTVVDRARTGDDILDDALEHLDGLGGELNIPAALYGIAVRSEGYRQKALKRLVEHRVLRDEDGRFLWVSPSRQYPIIDDREQREVRERLRQILLTDEIPDPRDVVLLCLVESSHLLPHVLSPEELAGVARRIEQLTRLDLIGQAVHRAVADIRSTVKHATSQPH
ncbi:MAG TPA: GPP34 family phosphoprotein [Stellaceae bacterium]